MSPKQRRGPQLQLINVKMRRQYELLSFNDREGKEMLTYDTVYSMLQASRNDFRRNGHKNGAFRKAFPRNDEKPEIRVLEVIKGGTTKHYPILKTRAGDQPIPDANSRAATNVGKKDTGTVGFADESPPKIG